MSGVYIRFSIGPGDGAEPRSDVRVLARLLARADGAVAIEDWREDAMRFVTNGRSGAPAVGPVALWAATRAHGSGAACGTHTHAFVATPLHCVAGHSSVGLPWGGIVRLEPGEAGELAADFNPLFEDAGCQLIAAPEGGLVCVFERPSLATTRDPEFALGHDIGAFLPTGRDGAALRGLMSEIEMWLFDHPVNRRRAATQRLPVTGLWLWGGGPLLTQPLPQGAWVAGEDVLLSAWPRLAAWPAPPARLAADHSPPAAGLVVLAQSPDEAVWTQWESTWLAPAEASLRAGRITSIALSAGACRYHLGARACRRFWRRPRPWRDYFAASSAAQ